MEGKTIQSIQRAIDIMNCFNENVHELSLKEISEKVGLRKSTAQKKGGSRLRTRRE